MKIAMIGHKRIPSREGGIEIVVDELATRMVSKGHTVVAYNRKGHHVAGKENDNPVHLDNYNGIKIIEVPTFNKSSLNAVVYSFLATIRTAFGHYNVVHYHASGPCVMLGLAKLLGMHTVATIHGLDSQRAKWGRFASWYLRFGEKMAAKYADQLIVLSENVKDYYKATYNREAVYVPNGINKPEILEAQLITEKFGLIKDEYILFLARVVPEKGLHYLIDAYKQINTNKKLCIVGGSSDSDDYVNKIKNMIAGEENIIFAGFQQGQVLEEMFSNAYCYVLPSDVEGMPISLLEAMSYGNCCLTSDIPENVNVISDMGVTFNKSDVVDLREKLEYLLTNEDIVFDYKNNASEYILDKFKWDDIVEETLRLYKK